jgi:exodeoxyribonuclease VII large subunit
VVPDVREQWQLIESARMQMHMRVSARVDNEIRLIDGYANRPSLTHPLTMLEPHQRFLDDAKQRMERGLTRIVDDASLTALSPQSTLNRGYAVVQGDDGRVVDDARDVRVGDELTLTLKHGVVVSHATAVGDQRQQGKAK